MRLQRLLQCTRLIFENAHQPWDPIGRHPLVNRSDAERHEGPAVGIENGDSDSAHRGNDAPLVGCVSVTACAFDQFQDFVRRELMKVAEPRRIASDDSAHFRVGQSCEQRQTSGPHPERPAATDIECQGADRIAADRAADAHGGGAFPGRRENGVFGRLGNPFEYWLGDGRSVMLLRRTAECRRSRTQAVSARRKVLECEAYIGQRKKQPVRSAFAETGFLGNLGQRYASGSVFGQHHQNCRRTVDGLNSCFRHRPARSVICSILHGYGICFLEHLSIEFKSWIARKVAPLIQADTITKIPDCSGAVLVTASHGGRYTGRLAIDALVRAVIFHDAGVGRENAGVAALPMLGNAGIGAAAVSHLTCRIGDSNDMLARGIISHANAVAAAVGVAPGMTCAEAASLLEMAPHRTVRPPELAESRVVRKGSAGSRSIVLIDSASLVDADEDIGSLVVTGSHGGLVGGNPASALRVDAFAAAFNDAGIGIDSAGIGRLDALDRRNIAAVTVGAETARIGEAHSTFEGSISAANAVAKSRGAQIGMKLGDLFLRWSLSDPRTVGVGGFKKLGA